MNTRCFRHVLAFALLASVVAALGLAGRNAPSLVGSYMLESRELPDGKRLTAPDIVGMLTFTKDRRNFNVYWTENGKPSSISTIAEYTLSETEYAEKDLYFAQNLGGAGITYDMTGRSGKAPVEIKDGKVTFRLPLHDEPVLTIEPDGNLTASRPGVFIDRWKRIR